MTPCQVSKEAEQELAVKAMSSSKEEMNLRCVSNCEDTTFDMDALLIDQKVRGEEEDVDVDVDVVGCTDSVNGFRFLGKEGDETDDGTEYSSSFGDTCSEDEDGPQSSDNEVDSIYGDSNLFEGFDSLFHLKKKRVTDHWRRYVSPLTWRSKWIELRMKQMKSQLSKYERELESYAQKEQQLELGQCTSGDCSMKLLPYSGQNHKKEVMKRRRRKKIEDMVDVSLYMSQHNLFSYYENKKSDADSLDDDSGIQPIAADVNSNDDFDASYACPSLEFRDENSLEHVLWRIEKMQCRVQKIRSQIDKLLIENAAKFSSVESLTELAQSDDPSGSPRSPAIPPTNVETVPTISCIPSQQLADHPETVVSSHGEAAPPPEIIERPIGPSSEEVHLDQSYFVGSSQNVVNDVAHNQEVKEEPQEFEKHGGPPVKSLVEVKVENAMDSPSIVPGLKSESQEANITRQNSIKRPLPSELNGAPTKKKRGERKASSGSWNADAMVTQILS